MSNRGLTIWWPIYISRSLSEQPMWNSTAFSEKRSESRSQRSMQKYQYFKWGSTLNLLKRGIDKTLCKSTRNLAKIQMSPKHVLPRSQGGPETIA